MKSGAVGRKKAKTIFISSRTRWRLRIVIVMILLAAGFFLLDLKLKHSMMAVAESQVQLSTVHLIQTTVLDKVVSSVEYEDMITVFKDNDGKIILLQANAAELNRIMARVLQELTLELQQLGESMLQIPLGQVTGVSFLSGYGPRLDIKIIPAGQLYLELDNRFEQAGINQTRHLIYLNIEAVMLIAVPFMEQEVRAQSVIPLAESIIVGEVPQTYINLGLPRLDATQGLGYAP